MNHTFSRIALGACAALLSGCSGEESQTQTKSGTSGAMEARASEPKPAAKALTTSIAAPEKHRAICGHVLPEVGHCGNYVEIEGQWIEVLWPELGVMEWCRQGKKGAEVEIAGAMKDGKFVATALKTLPANQ